MVGRGQANQLRPVNGTWALEQIGSSKDSAPHSRSNVTGLFDVVSKVDLGLGLADLDEARLRALE
jgi:hypothetical protein